MPIRRTSNRSSYDSGFYNPEVYSDVGGGVSSPAAPVPTFQAVGGASAGGSTSSPSWPTHQTGDIGLFVIETAGDTGSVTVTTVSGWAAVPNTPVVDIATSSGSKLAVFWKRAESNAEPTPVGNGSNHTLGRIYTFRGCAPTGDPWDVTASGSKTTPSTTATIPAVTTTVNNTLIVMIAGRPDDSSSTTHFGVPVNGNLTDLAECAEAGTSLGHGGGYTVARGTKGIAGDTGTSTMTKAVSTTDTYIVIALKG